MEAFQLRLWDGRIGRWLSPDPYGEFFSPYMGMWNNPISLTDPDGGSTNCPTCPGSGTTKDPWILNEVVIKGVGKSNTSNLFGIDYSRLPSSGAYGWNDGSAERFWNETMPVTSDLFNIINGIQNRNASQTLKGVAFTAINVFTLGEGGAAIKGTQATVETYALTAKASGYYPVMTRGFKNATELVYLEAGAVWKYGVTKNPFSRYTQNFLRNLGEYGVKYEKIFESTLRTEALTVEKMLIEQYKAIHGVLAPGNKVKF